MQVYVFDHHVTLNTWALNISALGTYRLPSDEKSDIVVEAAVTRIASTVTSEPNQQPLMIE